MENTKIEVIGSKPETQIFLVCYDIPKKFEYITEEGEPVKIERPNNWFNGEITHRLREQIKSDPHISLNKSVYLCKKDNATAVLLLKENLQQILSEKIEDGLKHARGKRKKEEWEGRKRDLNAILQASKIYILEAKDLSQTLEQFRLNWRLSDDRQQESD